MAQSSSYKQYNRTTRVLTEESGFAGGMLWTGNNIDETHLKAIVNCDYDDTTGYLKARSPFSATDDSPSPTDLEALNLDLGSRHLLGAYNICAFDEDDSTQNAGWLYIFADTKIRSTELPTVEAKSIVCVYHFQGHYYKCELAIEDDVTLKNINPTNLLINYENQLFGLGTSSDNPEAWLHVYRLTHSETEVDGFGVHSFVFEQRSYEEYIKPKIDAISLLEAGVTGFNAARGKDAFKYDSKEVTSPDEQNILGVSFEDENGNTVVSPSIGTTVTVRVPTAYVADKKNYLAMFQLKDNGDGTATELEEPWQHMGTATSEDGVFEFAFNFSKKRTTLYFTYYGDKDPGESVAAYAADAVDYLTHTVTAGDKLSNLKLKGYDLTSVNGSCIWKNRMCIWGVQNNNSLFFSEVDNFYYYPIPNNVALFTTNVVSCIPYKDTLLVFTADKVYRISENNDGSFTQTIIQNDMPLTQEDAPHLVAVKNMVLFKSGNYFYMIVPKSQSLTDELSIAPIYKNVAGFLNTLDKSMQEVLQLLYPEYLFNSCGVSGPSAVYAEQDTVHILYDISANVSYKNGDSIEQNKARAFKLFLNYNTNLRAWTLYVEDTTNKSLDIAVLTSERKMSFVRVFTIQNKSYFDIVVQQDDTSKSSDSFRLLLDTGYRTLSTAAQKRFREIQLKVHHAEESITSFGTAFLVDGVWRRNYSKLQETLIADNQVSLMPVMDLNTFVTELSMPVLETGQIEKNPGSDAIELNSWTLDFSHFKREAPTTIRIPVSGKGYSPRFIFMAPEATGLTINEINWVYRLMYGR